MKVRYYKWVMALITAFLSAVCYRLTKDEASQIDEDTVESVFGLLDEDHDGMLNRKEQSFLRFCAKNASLPAVFASESVKFISQKQFRLGIRPFVSRVAAECKSELQKVTDPYQIADLTPKRRKDIFKEVYDLNRDGLVEWREYALVNHIFGTDLGESSTAFMNRDLNKDFVLTKDQQ